MEHHLFPAISFCHYPAIAEIVKDECAKRGVPYARYDTLPEVRAPPALPALPKRAGVGPDAPLFAGHKHVPGTRAGAAPAVLLGAAAADGFTWSSAVPSAAS